MCDMKIKAKGNVKLVYYMPTHRENKKKATILGNNENCSTLESGKETRKVNERVS